MSMKPPAHTHTFLLPGNAEVRQEEKASESERVREKALAYATSRCRLACHLLYQLMVCFLAGCHSVLTLVLMRRNLLCVAVKHLGL